jgi:hypothetical protein
MASKKEIWKAITIDGKKPTVPYVISNHGRFGVMRDDKVEVKQIQPAAGRYRYNVRQKGKNKAIFLAKEVAKAFLTKPSPRYSLVIHKDHNYLNDHVDNLKWATKDEHRAHTANSPGSLMATKKKAITGSSRSKVLNEKNVIALKKMIWDPKRKLSFKQIAEKFGVSEMQVYRLKKGEFWYHIHVDGEPEHDTYKRNLKNIAFHEKRAEQAQKAALKKSVKKASSQKAALKKTKKKTTASRK